VREMASGQVSPGGRSMPAGSGGRLAEVLGFGGAMPGGGTGMPFMGRRGWGCDCGAD
jgi:hypothetical protein